MENTLIVSTIPREFTNSAKEIMRDCIFEANLIATKNSQRLQFVTESK